MRYRDVATLGVVLAAFAIAGASAASADTLLYEQGNEIWLANPDGTGARAITSGGPFTLPSEADNGTVVALGPGTTTTGGPIAFGNIWVMDDQGHVNHTISTYEDVPCTGLTLPIGYMQISPDASKIAYFEDQCVDHATWWSPTSATGVSDAPNQTDGQEELDSPVWMDNNDLLLDQVTEPFQGPAQEFNTYATGGGDGSYSPWFSDTDGADMNSGWATFFYSTISRQGNKIAVIETDDNFTPQRVELHMFTTNGPPPAAPTLACTITLPPAADVGTYVPSPSFSSDGSLLAFHEADGIHVANVSNLANNCAGVTMPLVVSGANDPSFGAAALPPISSGGGGGGGGGGGKASAPTLSHLHLKSKTLHKGHGQLTVSYSDSVAGSIAATIERQVTGVRHGSACAALHGKLKHGQHACHRFVKVSSASHNGQAGANTFTLPAHLTNGLKPGAYELVLVEHAGGTASRPATLSFRVV